MLNKTIGECLEERAKILPDEIALEFENQKITWREVDKISDWLALRFHSFGMKRGSRAAIWCGNHLQWVFVFYGLQKIGATTILLNPGYQDMELYQAMYYAKVEYLFYGSTYKNTNLLEILDRIDLKKQPFLKEAIPIEEEEAIVYMEKGVGNLTDSARRFVKELEKEVEAQDTACILFTSGTTSKPKGVMLSHYNLVNNSFETARQMHWQKEDKICLAVPLFHCFGITSCLLASLHTGGCLHIMKYYHSIDAIKHVKNYRCSVLNGVPTMFLAMINNPSLKEYDLSSLKSGIMAGSAISKDEYIQICEKLDINHLQMSYGQTETSPAVTFSSYEDSVIEKADNVGLPVADINVRIWNMEKNCLSGMNETGEIQVKGYLVMKGYFEMEEETKASFTLDGWLHTGDYGWIDDKGRIHFQGRIKEIIIRSGENISPKEIEECILELPEIKQAKVIGIPARITQEEIVACIIRKQGYSLSEERIKRHIAQKMACYKVPKFCVEFREFPLNASGKIQIEKLRQSAIERIGGKECILQSNMN